MTSERYIEIEFRKFVRSPRILQGSSSMFNRDEARSLAISADGNERYLSREIRPPPPLPPPPRYSFNKQPRGVTREYKSSSALLPRPLSYHGFVSLKRPSSTGTRAYFHRPKPYIFGRTTTNSRNEMVPYSGIPLSRRHFLPSPLLLTDWIGPILTSVSKVFLHPSSLLHLMISDW